jgi:hypothetical protein
MQSDEWLTKHDVARELKVHPNHVGAMVRQGRFPQPIRLSNTFVRWSRAEFEAWKRQHVETRGVAREVA